jgi:Domain of unknown function (DUF397)
VPVPFQQSPRGLEGLSMPRRSASILWRKSSWSTFTGNCVEVARLGGGQIGVRDSKATMSGPILRFSLLDWSVFLTSLKNGRGPCARPAEESGAAVSHPPGWRFPAPPAGRPAPIWVRSTARALATVVGLGGEVRCEIGPGWPTHVGDEATGAGQGASVSRCAGGPRVVTDG